MTNISQDYIARVIAAAPFADNEAGIPQMVELLRALNAELLAARAKLEAAEKLADASERIAKSMHDMLEAGDAIRNLSALGRASLDGEVGAVFAAIAAWEAAQ